MSKFSSVFQTKHFVVDPGSAQEYSDPNDSNCPRRQKSVRFSLLRSDVLFSSVCVCEGGNFCESQQNFIHLVGRGGGKLAEGRYQSESNQSEIEVVTQKIQLSYRIRAEGPKTSPKNLLFRLKSNRHQPKTAFIRVETCFFVRSVGKHVPFHVET